MFIFDGATVRPFEMDIDPFLKANQVFCAATNERELVFGTVNNGIIIKDITNGSNTFVNMSTGLQNNTVLSIDFDRMDNIWLGLDNGIDYVLYNSPVSTIFGTSNIYGAGYASMLLETPCCSAQTADSMPLPIRCRRRQNRQNHLRF